MSNAADVGERWARSRPAANPAEPCESLLVSQGDVGDGGVTHPCVSPAKPDTGPNPGDVSPPLPRSPSPKNTEDLRGWKRPERVTQLQSMSPTVPKATWGISTPGVVTPAEDPGVSRPFPGRISLACAGM